MAIRLPVVLAQHARRVAAFTDCEESWITSLLFEERLDATLVSDLASIQPDSTDFLCLSGLKGDFVLVSWENSSVVLRELVRLGFDNFDIVPVDGTAKVSSPQRTHAVKKIYLMGFNKGLPVSELVGQLKQLLESKATPVFQLQVASKVANPPISKVLPVVSDFSAASKSLNEPLPREHLPTGIPGGANFAYEDDDFPHIDTLVDELDRFDS